MATTNCIPACTDFSFDGMLFWFAEMSKRDLLFHPDDEPAEIVSIRDGTRFFSSGEARVLRKTIAKMFSENGDDVYEAAYPIFMNRFGIQLDA